MMKSIVTLATMLFCLVIANAVNWTGATSINWDTGSNWSSGTVPTLTTDVVIPAGTVRSPQVIWASGNCRDLTIQAGATLTISGTFTLNVRNITSYGALVMSSTGNITSTGNISWESGATASIGSSNPRIYLQGNMTFQNGSDIQMSYGTIQFNGGANANLINYSVYTQMCAVEVYKTYPASLTISSSTTSPLTLNSNLYNYTGSTLINNYSGTVILKGSLTDNNLSSDNGKIIFNSGILKLDGLNPSISLKNPNCYLQEIIFSQTGTAQLAYPLTLKGHLTIESGVFSPQANTITIGGTWSNLVGPAAFTEGSGRVIFNGTAHQYCSYTETFNILEVNKAGGALRVNSAPATVTCAQYDWTAGAIDVLLGTFTANDLVDNGLFGSYYCNPDATLNLTNNDGFVDLGGNVTITGGTVNIYGGTTDSYWPYSNNATLTMSAGNLIFHDTGIRIQAPGTLNFTANISGGSIQTSGDFTCLNSSFNPTEGEVRMIGSLDANLTVSAGSLNFVIITKSSRNAGEAALSGQAVSIQDRNGDFREEYRSNTVTLTSNLVLNTSLWVFDGTLWINGHEVNTGYHVHTYNGTLKMDSPLDRIVAQGDIKIGGSANITQGVLETYGDFEISQNSNVVIPASVSIYLRSTGNATLDWWGYDPTQIGNLFIAGSGGSTNYNLSCGFPGNLLVNISGNLSIAAGNTLTMSSSASSIEVGGNLSLNGTLLIDGMDINLQGKPIFGISSTLSVTDGSFAYYDSTAPRYTDLTGIINLDNSVFHAEHNSLIVRSGSTNTVTGSSSQIICDGITASFAGTFQPAAGTVKLNSNLASATFQMNVSSGNWLPNVIIDTNTGISLASNLIIKGNLQIISGFLDVNSMNYSITISGNWENQIGINAFREYGGRVVFNGTADQYCNYTESFSILEVNKISGYFIVNNSNAVVTCAQYDWTAGGINILAGTFTANDLADSGLYGAFLAMNSTTINLTNNDGYVDLNGYLEISGNSTVNIFGGTAMSDWSYGGNAALTMSGGTLDFKNQGIRIYNSPTYTFTTNISGGTIRTVGGFEINRAGFDAVGGSVEMYGSTDANLSMSYGTILNLIINKAITREEENLPQTPVIAMDKEGNTNELTRSNTVNVVSSIDLVGIEIQSGVFNASNQTIHLSGGWSNEVGDTGFAEGQSTVIFDGSGTQHIYTNEKFWNLTLAKTGAPSDLSQDTFADVYVANEMNLVNGYYRAGWLCDTYVKNLTIESLACFYTEYELYVSGNMYDYNTTYGESVGYVQSGVIAFNGTGDQTIYRSGVEFRAYNLAIDKPVGTRCYFGNPVILNGSIHILGGIWQDTANNFTHQLRDNLFVWANGAIANDTNNTFTFVGDMVQNISYAGSSGGFTNIIVNKSAAGRNLETASEKELRDGERSVDVTLFTNLILTNSGSLTIESGNFYSNTYDITCPGNFTVNGSTAAAYIEAGSTVRMGIVRNLNVNAGLLSLAGSATEPVTITSINGLYNFNVESGANFSAIYTIFEKMTANGVNIKNGALVNTTDPFKNCTFQNGGSGGTLLTLNSNQTLNIVNAVFPANTWSGTNNVKKTLNQGTVNFNMATGAFSGATFESDTYNRINWLGGSPDLRITSINWSSNTPYICDPVTATVHVQNNSTTNITTAFRVDLYKNRSTAPPAGLLGDSYITLSSLAAGATTTVTFTNISTETPGTWTSWFQVDANGLITETNESNNVWTPAISTTWSALPVAQNLQAVRSGNNVSLSWTYPISVYRYKIYKDTNPYGSFSTLAGTSATTSFTQAISGTKWFYRVRAERLLP